MAIARGTGPTECIPRRKAWFFSPSLRGKHLGDSYYQRLLKNTSALSQNTYLCGKNSYMCLHSTPALKSLKRKRHAFGGGLVTHNKTYLLKWLLSGVLKAAPRLCFMAALHGAWVLTAPDSGPTSFLTKANPNLPQQPAPAFLPGPETRPRFLSTCRRRKDSGERLPEHTLLVHPACDSLKEWCMDGSERGRWPQLQLSPDMGRQGRPGPADMWLWRGWSPDKTLSFSSVV